MAGSIFNKILNLIGLEETVIEENPEAGEPEAEEQNQDQELEEPSFWSRQKKGKVVNIHTSSYVKVVIYQPTSFEDTQIIINNLKNRKPIVVNLEALDTALAQRVLDFISGAVYALDGTIQKVSRGIFVLAPSNIDIVGNIPEELKGKSFYTLANIKEEETE
ncbi:cell division protein SepF [Caldicoprobacter algeriensis]|uniref:cell division protein SepF n=1 Tax=Caldicoprobacter algeriensis TaxID=699281 RepID=UPI00207A2E64|nr:cell division protein SepF [Caldicoprobacter algeriensis]MCM8899683.1 cell division protein SepF [Caldicoprobacter algeriensis]